MQFAPMNGLVIYGKPILVVIITYNITACTIKLK